MQFLLITLFCLSVSNNLFASFTLEEGMVLKPLFICPESRAVYDQVKAKYKSELSVDFLPRAVLGGSAASDPESGIIRIAKDLSDERKLDNFLFELVNLSQSDKINTLVDHACSFTSREFASRVERIEYDTNQISNKIRKACAAYGFDQTKSLEFSSFSEALKFQKQTGHWQRYVEYHKNACPKS